MINIKIYTDGACNQEANTGGWSFIMLSDEVEILSARGSEVDTTNNKCEMMGAIKGLEALETQEFSGPIFVSIISDSAYLVNGFKQNWIGTWLKNGWLNSKKEPVANKELWEALIFLQKKYSVDFVQIKRCSNKFASRVDAMAKNRMRKVVTL